MENIKDTQQQQNLWSQRYIDQRTGWDIGYPSTPLKTYFDQLTDKELKILLPGAGNAYEAEYLFQAGFKQVFILDISAQPLTAFKQRVPNFPASHLLQANFFEHTGQYDLIVEQTFFCSFPPTTTNRRNYAQKMEELLRANGKLVGLWFNIPLTGDMVKRPFGGNKTEYLSYLSPYFDALTFEEAYNSIPPRAGNELFGIFRKKEF